LIRKAAREYRYLFNHHPKIGSQFKPKFHTESDMDTKSLPWVVEPTDKVVLANSISTGSSKMACTKYFARSI